MKLVKTIAVGALALALASVASATSIKITGSTAIRKALYASIVRSLATGGHTVRTVSCDPNFNNKTPDGAQQAVFINDANDSVVACLTGSVGGLGYVIGGDPVTTGVLSGGDVNKAWLTVPSYASISTGALIWPTVSVNAGGTFTYGTATGASVNVNSVAGNLGQTTTLPAFGSVGTPFSAPSSASITMTDSFQNSTIYNSVDFGIALNDTQTGTVSFAFCKGAAHPSVGASYGHLTNITAQNMQALVNKGYIDLSQITGDTVNDSGIDVVLVGRNSDSGTRLGVFAETGVGPVTTGANQYIALDKNGVDVSLSTSTGKVDHFALVASDQDGYDSGAFVKATLAAAVESPALPSTKGPGGHPFIEVGYVSAGDLGGTQLTYNGVALTQGNVINGTYTLWTTEHFMYDASAVTGADLTLATLIKGNITATNSNGLYVNQGGLSCSRATVEGSTVTHN